MALLCRTQGRHARQWPLLAEPLGRSKLLAGFKLANACGRGASAMLPNLRRSLTKFRRIMRNWDAILMPCQPRRFLVVDQAANDQRRTTDQSTNRPVPTSGPMASFLGCILDE